MKNKIKIIFNIVLWSSRKEIINRYSKEFYIKFHELARENLDNIIDEIPNIGDSIFALNYCFGPCYISWYKAYLELGLNSQSANEMIWKMNELFINLVPKAFMGMVGNKYIGYFRRKGKKHEFLSERNEVHSFDWKIRYRNINSSTFEIDIYECGMIKLCDKFNAMGLLPMMCRMDYLFSHYMRCGFERTKTLADGDECCNCRYIMGGSCQWAPEKGFKDRK